MVTKIPRALTWENSNELSAMGPFLVFQNVFIKNVKINKNLNKPLNLFSDDRS